MDNVESITLDAGQQQDAARQLDFERLQKAQAEKQAKIAKQNDKRQRAGVTALPQELIGQGVRDAALQAWSQLWQKGHEIVEGVALAFFGAGSLIGGPPAIIMFLIRFWVGNIFGGGFEISSPIPPPPGPIKIPKISVPLVPPMGPVEMVYRSTKIVWISVLTFVIYMAILMAAYIYTNPGQVAKAAWLYSLCLISKLFGGTCT